jgi:hypothetical protein
MVQARRIRVADRLPGRKNSRSGASGGAQWVTSGSRRGQAGVTSGSGRGGTRGQVKDATAGLTAQRAALNVKMQEIGCRFACTLA